MRTRYTRARAVRELQAYSREDGPVRLPEHLRAILRAAARILDSRTPLQPVPSREAKYDIQEYKVSACLDPLAIGLPGQAAVTPDVIMHFVRREIYPALAQEMRHHVKLDIRQLPGGVVEIQGRAAIGTPKQETVYRPMLRDWEWEEAMEMPNEQPD